MAESDDRIIFETYTFNCPECKSSMIFEMTFSFETDIDVFCPCTNIMIYAGENK